MILGNNLEEPANHEPLSIDGTKMLTMFTMMTKEQIDELYNELLEDHFLMKIIDKRMKTLEEALESVNIKS